MTINEIAKEMKLGSSALAASGTELRNNALLAVKNALISHKEEIFAANREDLERAERDSIAAPIVKRLRFDEGKLRAVTDGIDELIKLPDPIGTQQLKRELDGGLTLTRVSCPIGVIGVIFEARPDALVQISSLCLKSGNCALLKGGSETASTNRVLFNIIKDAAVSAGIPSSALYQLEARSEIAELLSCGDYVDLLIPRGSNAFVRYIMDNTVIPVMGHADGICHTYVDAFADLAKAVPVVVDAKTQYTAVCNATETLLVNRSIAKEALPLIGRALTEHNVTLRAVDEASDILSAAGIDHERVTEEAYRCEYLDYIITVGIVDSTEAAVNHINLYGSHHTDCIITENAEAAEFFMQRVDSADVFLNCSTRFADGFRFGFGAEVGISTGKLHARGPVGLEGLCTYKYRVVGNGHIVADYAEGRKQFHFKDL